MFYIAPRIPKVLEKVPADWPIDKLVEFTMSVGRGLIRPQQNNEEIIELLEQLRQVSPSSIVEIGAARGGTLFLWSRVSSNNAILTTVDQQIVDWRINLFKSFASRNQKLHVVIGDSHSMQTLSQVKKLHKDAPVDFLFIDGDHTYQGVKADFEMWRSLVRKGGLIAFHDILYRDETGGVAEFWREVKDKYNYKEIIYSSGMGIGIVFI